MHNSNHSIELRGDSMQSKVGQRSAEEMYFDIERWVGHGSVLKSGP